MASDKKTKAVAKSPKTDKKAKVAASKAEAIANKKKADTKQVVDKKKQNIKTEKVPEKKVADKKQKKPEPESSEEESSEEVKATKKNGKKDTKKVDNKKKQKKEESSSEESDDSNESSDDSSAEEETKATSVSDESSSESDNEEDEDEDEEEVPAKSVGKRKADSSDPPAKFSKNTDGDSTKKRQELTLFVGNLPWDSTEDDLTEFFADCNVTSIRLVKDNNTGKPKGYGYLDFPDNDSLEKALAKKGEDFCGRDINIDRTNTSVNVEKSKTLFVGNLSWQTTEDSLMEFFSSSGNVSQVRIITDKETGESKGFAYVEFEDLDSADAASQLHGSELDGRNLRINFEGEKKGGDRGGRGGFGGRGGGRGGFDRGGRGGFGRGGGRGFGDRGGRGGGRGGFGDRGGRGGFGDRGGRGGGRGGFGDRGGRGGRGGFGDRGGRGGGRGRGNAPNFQGKRTTFD